MEYIDPVALNIDARRILSLAKHQAGIVVRTDPTQLLTVHEYHYIIAQQVVVGEWPTPYDPVASATWYTNPTHPNVRFCDVHVHAPNYLYAHQDLRFYVETVRVTTAAVATKALEKGSADSNTGQTILIYTYGHSITTYAGPVRGLATRTWQSDTTKIEFTELYNEEPDGRVTNYHIHFHCHELKHLHYIEPWPQRFSFDHFLEIEDDVEYLSAYFYPGQRFLPGLDHVDAVSGDACFSESSGVYGESKAVHRLRKRRGCMLEMNLAY
ncbi:hypothetical protein O6H91_15G057600 [Diphasiastrum complanatum]|uniref:Uncharacterized protein n=1 Tax=Diphasiastrum complanatum TaxID=34168 RepID=A0ACC2BIG9_DIPCM|nr:hypothetical protein O6H91_15G057600 [Diphasiastrum complanatum]